MPANVETMAFFGQVPWHGLGTKLDAADVYDWPTAAKKAGLDWEAELVPLQTADTQQLVESRAVRRSTDKRILGVVGARYTVLQNREAFAWFEPFLQLKEAQLHTAGSLAEGSRIWVLAKLERAPMEIAKDDTVEKYVLLSHSHDGTLAVRVGFTPIRVVCSNTLAMAHSAAASKLIRVKHSQSVHSNLENIRKVMNLANAEFEATAEQYKLLARKDINGADLAKYVNVVLGIENEAEASTRIKNQAQAIVELFETGAGSNLPGSKTYWGAYNAVTNWLSYARGNEKDSRLNSLWFGPSANMNKEALDTALELAGAV